MDARWLREELAGIHDRLNYLAREMAHYRNQDINCGDRPTIITACRRAGFMALQAVKVVDRDVLEHDTLQCPVCKMLAHPETDQDGSRWRVCEYCGAAEQIDLPADAATLSSNLDDALTPESEEVTPAE